jgi:hypothetical protein
MRCLKWGLLVELRRPPLRLFLVPPRLPLALRRLGRQTVLREVGLRLALLLQLELRARALLEPASKSAVPPERRAWEAPVQEQSGL